MWVIVWLAGLCGEEEKMAKSANGLLDEAMRAEVEVNEERRERKERASKVILLATKKSSGVADAWLQSQWRGGRAN